MDFNNSTIKNLTFTAIDFETANWYRSSACSIGLVRVEDGIIVDEFQSLLRPDPFFFQDINISIHGITEEMCRNAPPIAEIFGPIEHWIHDQILVAHNAPFEKSVIKHLFAKHNILAEVKDYCCTLYMSRVHFRDLSSYKLPDVYRHVFKRNINHHDALEDARACAEIALAITNEWQPPFFDKMVTALYEKPASERKAEVSITKLTKDEGYEENDALKGKNFTFTGELSGFSREEAAQFVVNRGAKVNSTVTNSTTHLVLGGYSGQFGANFQSNKFKKAQELIAKGKKIKIIGDQEFLVLVDSLEKNQQLI